MDLYTKVESRWLIDRFSKDKEFQSIDLKKKIGEKLKNKKSIRALDIGTGSGANLLHIPPFLPCEQHWILMDRDQEILKKIPHDIQEIQKSLNLDFQIRGEKIYFPILKKKYVLSYKVNVAEYHQADLSGFDLIVANAVFDLSSSCQFEKMVKKISEIKNLPVLYFSINLSGSNQIATPKDIQELSEKYSRIYSDHMCRQQIFGQAMGDQSAAIMKKVLNKETRYIKYEKESNWEISPEEVRFLMTYLNFFVESIPSLLNSEDEKKEFFSWIKKLSDYIKLRKVSLIVPHHDLLYIPK